MSSRTLPALALGLSVVAVGAPAFAQGWSFSTGADYTSGDYGTGGEDTTILIVPFSVGYTSEHWRASVTAPYVRVEGAAGIIPGTGAGGGSSAGSTGGPSGGGLLNLLNPGGGGLLGTGLFGSSTPSAPPTTPTPTSAHIEEEGLGDVTLSLDYTPYIGDAGDRFTIGADVRAPTGDEDRFLGAGQTIGALTLDYSHPLWARTALYGGVGYQHAFDTEDDAWTANVGFEGVVADGVLVGVSGSWAESDIQNAPDETQAMLYSAFDAGDHVRLVGYALAGLSDRSPDEGAGFRVVLH